jgi:NADP-dependent 3-hydroxy acid dehydrogenase YdfG
MSSSKQQQFRLEGQVIGLVGASSGIGAAIAHALYGEGANVAIGARRMTKLQDVAKSCRGVHPTSPGDIIEFECDVTSRVSVEAFYDATTKHYQNSPMNSLVCCAGVMYFTKMKNAMMDQWDQTIDVNCRGATNCMGVAIPQMLKEGDGGSSGKKGGKLVFITSDAGVRDFQQLAVYCASKRFVETLCEITRRELVGTGVTLHTIQPGDVKGTELILQNTDQEAATTMGVEIGKPVGEGFSRDQLLDPSDVADAVVTVLTAPKHVAINSVLIEPRDQV